MADITEKFFNSYNSVEGITPKDYERAKYFVAATDAISKLAYESVYIIDYYAKKFLYVSQNPLFLCGCKPEEVEKMGYGFYLSHVPEDDLKMLLKINTVGFRFLNSQPAEERHLFSISYDFHLKNNGSNVLIHQKHTPLLMAPNGRIWLAVCYVSISNHDSPGNVEVRKLGQSEYWSYDLEEDKWERKDTVRLSEGEKEVLLLSARGLTVEEIARRVHRSKDTIKSRRRAIFEKLDVRSISEAIAFATNYKLI
ncbi:MAG: helix-turn-helix transcriptional regulator [Muribaculaceae bacterium]|nr:helix-turn-helix transcriptional regulator [Muribaculaceae bacterium]